MTPDDPRHGTYAGAILHWKDGEDLCDGCTLARSRMNKAAHVDRHRGRPRKVPLGDHAHRIVATIPRDQLSRATGIDVPRLIRLDRRGPAHVVFRSTRDKLIAAGTGRFWTPVGIQRRLRALHTRGWSAAAIAHTAGMHESPIRLLANRADPRYVKRGFAEQIIGFYDAHAMDVGRTGRGPTRARNHAAARGWESPLAWDDIDFDTSPAAGVVDDTYVDDAVVDRLLAGHPVPTATKAERCEAMARWLAWGRSERSLCVTHGWRDGRYTTREAVAS